MLAIFNSQLWSRSQKFLYFFSRHAFVVLFNLVSNYRFHFSFPDVCLITQRKKKSHDVRSGDRGRHRIFLKREITRFGNNARTRVIGALISRFGNILWRSQSPDLILCDFFFGDRYLIANIYIGKPWILAELKTAIWNLIEHVEEEMMRNVSATKVACYQKWKFLGDVIFLLINVIKWHSFTIC